MGGTQPVGYMDLYVLMPNPDCIKILVSADTLLLKLTFWSQLLLYMRIIVSIHPTTSVDVCKSLKRLAHLQRYVNY